MDCSPPGSSVHGILQARKLEWVACSFSKGSSLTQGLNLHLFHWQVGSLPLSHERNPLPSLLIVPYGTSRILTSSFISSHQLSPLFPFYAALLPNIFCSITGYKIFAFWDSSFHLWKAVLLLRMSPNLLLFIHFFIRSLNKYLLSVYHVSGIGQVLRLQQWIR